MKFGGTAIFCLLVTASASAAADFEHDIKPVLESSCLSCHGAAKALGGVRVDSRAAVIPHAKEIVSAIDKASSEHGAMPPGGPQLPAAQRNAIRDWLSAGATWPDSVALKATPRKALDERAVVAQLHDRIVKSGGQRAADMRPYRSAIAGTTASIDMMPIPAGEFTMGTPPAEPGRKPDEGPQHKVRIQPLWMQKFEVTWDQYRLFMFAKQAGEADRKDDVVDAVSRPTRPYVEMSFGMGIDGYPAISMTQHAANKFAEWLSARTGEFYRLPTEAEWEYACRAGSASAYYFGDDPKQLGDYAWYSANSDGKYQKTGTKKPNAWGLYDMLGNVMEWTLDQYTPAYPQTGGGVVDEPWVKATKPYPHTVRGGSWNDDPAQLRCGARAASDPSWKQQDPQLPKSIWYLTDAQWLGFRLVRPLKVPSAEEMYRYWNSGVEKE